MDPPPPALVGGKHLGHFSVKGFNSMAVSYLYLKT